MCQAHNLHTISLVRQGRNLCQMLRQVLITLVAAVVYGQAFLFGSMGGGGGCGGGCAPPPPSPCGCGK
ncbi:hypothetical protein PRIPAC_73495 [Pristionchus pacificus]|uniref:Uncharacterized protein n=1 Tax=Pristionchus pacificus TaxID=54126 RepID=A0A2A6C6K2_PRIPA|nr:hypothetical protein PRIPAC_73495 [Pristionchus pacificus]|eukprot:PDM73789.1 hypothetical protein PRIPAC_41145 [Pristionchus pacificus]